MTHILTHPAFGELERPLEAFITDRGVAYVGGFWGPTRIYANLPASDLEARSVTPSVAANALAEVATAAGHRVDIYRTSALITTSGGTLRITWGDGTAAEWRQHDPTTDTHYVPVSLSLARHRIS